MRYLGPTGMSLDAAIRDLASGSVRVRVTAAEALARLAPDQRERAAEALRPRLADPSPDVRYAVALAIGRLGDRDALAPLCDMLDDPEPMPRQAAAVALGEIGDPRAFSPLCDALRAGETDLRFQAVTAISLVNPAAAAAPLREAMADEDPDVRGSAAAALGDLHHDEARDGLAELASADADRQVRLEAALSLARLGDRRGTRALVAMLEDRQYGVLAAEHLFRCPDPGARQVLERALERWLGPPLLKVWAAGALVRLGQQDAREHLVQLLASRTPTVRGLTIQVLGEIDQPWCHKTLKKLIEPPVAAEWEGWREEILEALEGVGERPDGTA